MIHPERITKLNERSLNEKGAYVLYWMQQSQRTVDNHALEYAAARAAELRLPLAVWFGFTTAFPDANLRHYHFMFQGLKDVAVALAERGIPFFVETADPGQGAAAAGSRAALVITDAGYLRVLREWRAAAAASLSCPLLQVESDVVVPVEAVSPKEEYAAATIRKKIHRRILEFLVPVERAPTSRPRAVTRSAARATQTGEMAPPQVPSAGRRIDMTGLDDEGIATFLKAKGVDLSVKPAGWIRGGELEAGERLDGFLSEKLAVYDSLRNDPSKDIQSHLSPYLHFGQLSPLTVVLKLLDHEGKEGRRPFSAALPGQFRTEALSPGAAAFIEELVIRRELSANFCRYNPGYDSLEA
ncbi:MAG: deoxyribodipyrimidine photo-lyase, partial [Spirochaetales bacterium]|nr:deoxyribodipyrimidine photo-lyase [Spirochaetales bacterium]